MFWEDVEIGSEIPALVKNPTNEQLVKWAGASGDFYRIHYDKDFATSVGYSNVVVHGGLRSAWMGQLLGDWLGESGTLRKYNCRYRSYNFPGDTLTCRGKITNKYIQDKDHFVECEIWIEDSQGKTATTGSALVVLPSKTCQK